jgi:hypothetical protein
MQSIKSSTLYSKRYKRFDEKILTVGDEYKPHYSGHHPKVRRLGVKFSFKLKKVEVLTAIY